jgi:hypothetical protein
VVNTKNSRFVTGRVMSQNADDVKQIVMGYEMGLGEMREGSIEIDGEKLDNLRVQWRPAKLVNFAPQQGRGYIPDIAPAYVVGHPMGHSFG